MSHLHHPTLLHNRLPYFGRTGLVRNGLVAEYRFDESRNLLKYSQQFDNAAWAKTNSTITPNATTAPDGTTTADKLVENSDVAQGHRIAVITPTLTPNGLYTYSIYAKAAEREKVYVSFKDNAGATGAITVNLIDGTYTTGGTPTVAGYVSSVGDGWYRLVLVVNASTGGSPTPTVYVWTHNGTSVTYNGDGTSGIYIWGAQLEQGSVARTYYPTRDKQLLMDYSRPRKNLLLPNQANACEDGTTTGFGKETAGDTISASAGEVDEWQGTYCAKVDTANAAANEGIYTTDIIYNLKPSTAYTASGYIRGAAGGETVKLGLRETTDAGATVDTTGSDTLTLTTGWQRVTVSRTFGTTGRGARLLVYTPTQQNIVFYVDGLQLEEGATATAWEAPPNIGYCGSTTGSDTNDPTYTGKGLSHGADDYVTLGGIYNAAGTLQNGYGISIAFYTAEVTAATAKLCLVSFGANKGVYLGAVGEGLTDETITVQYSATSFTYATGTIAAGWHILDLVWNGAQYEIWLDGVQRTGTDVDTPALLSLSAVKMRYDGTTYGSGLTGAYSLKYNRAPTLAERNQNKAYLKSYLLRERGISI
jgi:hypothetical protein